MVFVMVKNYVTIIKNRISECLASCYEQSKKGQTLFRDRQYYTRFFDLLQEAADMFNIRIAAYLPNHYHILVQTRYRTQKIIAMVIKGQEET